MTDQARPAIDPERIAALLDGRLDAAQRAEMLAQIDASPEAFEAYAEAIAVLREIEAVEREPSATSSPSIDLAARRQRDPNRRTVGIGIGLAIAAAVVFAVVIPMRSQRGTIGGIQTVSTLVQSLSNVEGAARLVGRPPPWTEVRGAGDAMSPRGRAVRVGARATDLEVLVGRGDTTGRQIALEIASLIDGFPGGAPTAAAFRSMNADQSSLASIDAALRSAEAIAPTNAIRLGAWIEAARFAAAAHDQTFFRSLPAAREAAIRIDPASTETEELLSRIAREVSAQIPEWSAAERALDELLALLAR